MNVYKMNTDQYFLHLGYEYAAKNKLQLAALKFFKDLDGSLIDNIEDFQRFLTREVEYINSLHPRCKPITVSLRKFHENFHENTGFEVEGVEAVRVYLYKVKHKIN